MTDGRRHAPATERNRDPILTLLRRILPASGIVLEIASGTGEHAVHFAQGLPAIRWQPSDPDAQSRASIEAWRGASALPNLLPPIDLDSAAPEWPVDHADAIVCINMVHISPWEATVGLMRQSGALLLKGQPLVLYGPYLRSGVETAPSNLAFDADLRRRNGAWGIRQLDDVVDLASREGLVLDTVHEMPAKNLTVVFRNG
ncbi:MAG: hypothetical protein JWR77_1213 [Rhizorhabdus sp.]|nr:hypothetical protein [Rhizorhabdus sp.]